MAACTAKAGKTAKEPPTTKPIRLVFRAAALRRMRRAHGGEKRAYGRGFDYVCRRKRRQGIQACQGPNLAGETADNSIEQAFWRAISPYLQQAQQDNDTAKAAGLPQIERAIQLLSELPDAEPILQQLAARKRQEMIRSMPLPAPLYTLPLAQKQAIYREILEKIVWRNGTVHLYFQ